MWHARARAPQPDLPACRRQPRGGYSQTGSVQRPDPHVRTPRCSEGWPVRRTGTLLTTSYGACPHRGVSRSPFEKNLTGTHATMYSQQPGAFTHIHLPQLEQLRDLYSETAGLTNHEAPYKLLIGLQCLQSRELQILCSSDNAPDARPEFSSHPVTDPLGPIPFLLKNGRMLARLVKETTYSTSPS